MPLAAPGTHTPRRLLSIGVLGAFLLACAGPASGPITVAAPSSAAAVDEVVYRRFRSQEENATLDFVSVDRFTLFYTGRFESRPPLVGSWTQDGAEIRLTVDPARDGATGPVSMAIHRTGRCSLAIYRKELSDGSTWASGELRDDGINLIQPLLFEQKWPDCTL